MRAGRARFGSAAGLSEIRRGACRVTRTGVAGRGAGRALPSVACCGSRFGRGHGRALREAGPLGPAAACDRGRPGREPRRDRHCRVLVGGEQSAQRRFYQRPGGRAAGAAEVSVCGRFGAAAAGHAGATGRGLARHRRPQSEPRRRRAAATGQPRPDQPDRCQRPTAWASVPRSPARSAAPATPEFAAA